MQRLFKSKLLLGGILIGFLAGGSWLAWAAIQSQVGLNILDSSTGTWRPLRTLLNVDSLTTENTLPVIPMSIGSGSSPYSSTSLSLLTTALNNVPGVGLWVPSTTSGQVGFPLVRSAAYFNPCPASQASCVMIPSAPWLFDNVDEVKQRSISASNLTATTVNGTAMNVPLSTWSITNTPAAATQATISKAAGGGTVRHVATTITACSAQAGTAQTPIAINLRDGATGAGTILRTWKISTIIQDSKCVNLSGLAMIGTANTAMTIEFAAAGVAGSEQTVTLTGFSVP